jgi:lysophospholipase L1-like esterase
LTNNLPTVQAWEAFNIGVHGYSALQGLRMFQKIGRRLEPDIVTLYFGWNDHWLSPSSDRQLMGLEMRPLAGRIFEVLQTKRFFKFFILTLSPMQHLAKQQHKGQRVFRVPPAEYRSAMKAFIREIRASGAIPVIITAPRRSLTDQVVGKEYVRSIEEGNRIHDQYVEITRATARDAGAELLDLAVIFAGKECDAYFAPDGIHFDQYALEGVLPSDPPTQPGLMRIAEEIYKKIRAVIQTESWRKRHGG